LHGDDAVVILDGKRPRAGVHGQQRCGDDQ
jgi:hypothetical protein